MVIYSPSYYPYYRLGNLKRPHPTSPKMVVYVGNNIKMSLSWELKLFQIILYRLLLGGGRTQGIREDFKVQVQARGLGLGIRD